MFASGLAAENAVLQAHLNPGDEIIVPPDVYGGTHRLLNNVYAPKGYKITTVDFSDLDALKSAITSKTKIIWLESPTNPRLLIYDIAAISRLAHKQGALLVVDNTFATPVFQQPFDLGADIVVHSVTKYLAGHCDVIQGAVLTKDETLFEKIRFVQNACGGVPSAFDCWLTLRGLKTLDLRVRRQAETAAVIAATLSEHPAISRVYYPGLTNHPGHDIAKRQMSGFGGIVSVELNATCDQVRTFVSTLKYFALGESLGGVKSLICQPATMTHAAIPAEARAKLGLSDTLVRLSPGVEATSDLIEDLLEGLEKIKSAGLGRLTPADPPSAKEKSANLDSKVESSKAEKRVPHLL